MWEKWNDKYERWDQWEEWDIAVTRRKYVDSAYIVLNMLQGFCLTVGPFGEYGAKFSCYL